MAMNLLPTSAKEFSNKTYWEQFFANRGSDPFEWYGEYTDLCDILHQYIKPKDIVLHIGCGNSKLTLDLYDFGGIHNITNVDISETAINQMREKALCRPGMTFALMDVMKMTYEDKSYSVVLDKGTLDALATDESDETVAKLKTMFEEISRVLKIGGRYICVSLAQPHVVRTALEYFHSVGFMSRVIPVLAYNQRFPVFVYVFTKFMKMEGITPILEMCNPQLKPVRYEKTDDVLRNISDILEYSIIRHSIQNNKKFEDDLMIEFFDDRNPGQARYNLYIIDSEVMNPTVEFSVFIVPKGRELEWLFHSKLGRQDLCSQISVKRLVIVTLHRNHEYSNMESIKDELSSKIKEICPATVQDKQITFLTVGQNLDCRHLLEEGTSAMSGHYAVERVNIEHIHFRHLMFSSNLNIIQSQIRLVERTELEIQSKKNKTKNKKNKNKKKNNAIKSGCGNEVNAVGQAVQAGAPNEETPMDQGEDQPTADVEKKFKVDIHYLPPSYCGIMISVITFLRVIESNNELMNKEGEIKVTEEDSINVTIIGLGGGVLPMFLVRHFPEVRVECIEIDKDIAVIAERWFGFSTSQCKIDGVKKDRVTLKICDGLDHLEEMKQQGIKKHVLIIDADSKDSSIGMTGPPPGFITDEMLNTMHDLIHADGLLVMNLVCRDQQIRVDLLNRVTKIFSVVITCKLLEDLNEVIIAYPRGHYLNNIPVEERCDFIQTEMQNFHLKLLKEFPKMSNIDVEMLHRLSVFEMIDQQTE